MAQIVRRRWVRIAALMVVVAAGCTGVQARRTPVRTVAKSLLERATKGDPFAGHAADNLEAQLASHTEPGDALTLAELNYRAGLHAEGVTPNQALARYRDAATLAALSLADPNEPRATEAVSLHNQSVTRMIRVARSIRGHKSRTWLETLNEAGVYVKPAASYLDPKHLTNLRIVEDIGIDGMQHVYKNPGLGVPLVASRVVPKGEPVPAVDRFIGETAKVGVTAVLLPGGTLADGSWRDNPVTLNLLDPFEDKTLGIGGRSIGLASDRTAALAVQTDDRKISNLELLGLFNPDVLLRRIKGGVVMLRPYQRGKIPVVLVHGLYSSPRAWVQPLNELRNDPEIVSRYQFWEFLYPSGQPIPTSGEQLRKALTTARDVFDPDHTDPALDNMVLVGHSMGGLLTKMMIQDSGLTLWNATIEKPPGQLRGSPEILDRIEKELIYKEQPYITRAVFICVPHRGSPVADAPFGRTISRFVRATSQQHETVEELERLNGPDILAPELRGRSFSGIGNLRTDSIILKALNEIPISPRVPYHSIIPLIPRTRTDGLVRYESSHLDGAQSELITSGTHTSEGEPDVIAEVRRILLLHLATPRTAPTEAP